jgi:hypothetical protein
VDRYLHKYTQYKELISLIRPDTVCETLYSAQSTSGCTKARNLVTTKQGSNGPSFKPHHRNTKENKKMKNKLSYNDN